MHHVKCRQCGREFKHEDKSRQFCDRTCWRAAIVQRKGFRSWRPKEGDTRQLNHTLINARIDLGLTQKEAATHSGVQQRILSLLELGGMLAYRVDSGEWRVPALRLSTFYCMSCSELWPLSPTQEREYARTLEQPRDPETVFIERQQAGVFLSSLPSRARAVIYHRVVLGYNLIDLTAPLGVTSRERVRQLEAKALRLLRKSLPPLNSPIPMNTGSDKSTRKGPQNGF